MNKVTDEVYEELEDDDMSDRKKNYNTWDLSNKGEYYPYLPPKALKKKVEPGYYKLKYNNRLELPYIVKKNINTDILLDLPNPIFKKILNDVKIFWDREKNYREYGFVHRRGLLLYGSPGCGKTSIVQLLVKDLVENQKGVLFSIDSRHELEAYSSFISEIFREIEPNTPIMTIIEDIDGYLVDPDIESKLLNILDGVNHFSQNVTIATTNYINRLSDRIKARPSRFDRKYLIDLPNEEIREYYLRKVLLEKDLKKIDLKKWVKDTEGFTLAHLKELVASVIVIGNNYEEAIEELRSMTKNLDSSEYSGSEPKAAGFTSWSR